jgi:hypothetical protein
MERIARKAVLCLVSAVAVLLTACGGGGNSGGGDGGGTQPTTPTVTVSPAKTSIASSDTLQVNVTVTGTSSTPTGTITLSSGSYTSSAATLSGGSASVTIPAGSLAAGSATIKATYAPDSASSSKYNSASGTATVTVTSIVAPIVTVTPSSNSVALGQAFQVTISVEPASGSSTPTGTVVLTSGSYTSLAGTLAGGNATIFVPATQLALGSNKLTATYTPDSASSATYKTSTGTALVTVTVATPTVTVTPASQTVGTGQPLDVTVAVAGYQGGPMPRGNVTLAAGTFNSGATPLTNGSTTIKVPAGSMPAGTATLTASYSPDTLGSAAYGSASGTATVTVTSETTPTVTVSPGLQSLATSSSLSVTVKVAGPSGSATPTGSVVLSSGSYTSPGATLNAGSATITIPGYTLPYGGNTLSAAYTPDAGSAGLYNDATGSATVTVAKATPTVTVTPDSFSIDTSQALNVTVAVAGPGTGAPPATGAVTLTGGGYATPSPVTLIKGSATIAIAAGVLTAGSDTLTASYTPDATSSPLFNPATGQSAAVTVALMSTVTVNQSTAIAPVTNQLLGMNLANWYDVVGNSTAINSAFGKAGIKAIRWPGGSWSDVWHWHNNPSNPLLPYMCPAGNGGGYWGGYSPFSDFVTSIAKAGNYDLALTANYGSNAACNGGGDPAEAAGWVAEAVSEGYAPSHVTVGNENYGNWEFDLHTIKNDPTTYANSVIGSNGYYKLITAASPTTKVGVVVDANCTAASGCTLGWDSTVLSAAKGAYDFVEYHYYPQYADVTSDTYLVHQAALDFTTNIKTIKSELATAGTTGTPIYVGEIGANSSNPGTQSWSITQGLYAGQLLGEAMNNGIARLTWWIGFGNCLGAGNNSPLLYGWQDTWGALSIFSDTDPKCPGAGPIGTMSPTAQAFNLFQNIAVNGESALNTAVSGDTTNIRAYSATHSGGTALFLFNLNQTQAMPVTITLSKQSAANDVTVITYDKKIYDYTNPTCQTDPACTYDPTHDYTSPVWAPPTSKDYGAQSMPMTLTLTPWSMNVVVIK